jgi:hypothetical protein
MIRHAEAELLKAEIYPRLSAAEGVAERSDQVLFERLEHLVSVRELPLEARAHVDIVEESTELVLQLARGETPESRDDLS